MLLLVGAAYATLRAVEAGRTRWLLLAAALVGFGFLTKMLQAFLVLPAFAAVWLIAAPVGIGRRHPRPRARRARAAGQRGLVGARGRAVARGRAPVHRRLADATACWSWCSATTASAGSPATRSAASAAARAGAGRLGPDRADAAVRRPARRAGVLAAARRRSCCSSRCCGGRGAPRAPTHCAPPRCSGAAGCSSPAVTFSLMAGIFHGYYLVALAPAIAALVAIGAALLWRRPRRARPAAGARGRARADGGVGVRAAAPDPRRGSRGSPGRCSAAGSSPRSACSWPTACRACWLRARRALAIVMSLAGPAGYAVATAATPHTGAIPSAGPAGAGMGGAVLRQGPGPRRPGRRPGQPAAGGPGPAGWSPASRAAPTGQAATRPAGSPGAPAGAGSAGCSAPRPRRRPRWISLAQDAGALHLGGSGRRLQQRGRLPAGHRCTR